MKAKKKNKKKSSPLTTLLVFFVFIAGLALLLYPTVSEQINAKHASKAIASYRELVSAKDEDVEALLKAAENYNEKLFAGGQRYTLSAAQEKEYLSLLNLTGDGMMGYIEIPTLGCSLPVYHGTEENVLSSGVGHLVWSSLPVGGENTHTLLSGHRGLPSAKLFSELDKLQEGDRFTLTVLNRTLVYEIEEKRVVLPNELAGLTAEPGQDLCTLITCTPYGINTHRLLVRGRRVSEDESCRPFAAAEAIRVKKTAVAAVIFACFILLVLLYMTADAIRSRILWLKKQRTEKREGDRK